MLLFVDPVSVPGNKGGRYFVIDFPDDPGVTSRDDDDPRRRKR
jgi:hypothetical protein